MTPETRIAILKHVLDNNPVIASTSINAIRELLSIVEFQHQTILSVYQTSSEHSEKWNWCKETIEATAARLKTLGGGE